MYKILKGNTNFEISKSLELRRVDSKPHGLHIKDGEVEIELYGHRKVVELKWLWLMAYFGISLPMEYSDRIFDIKFEYAGTHHRYFHGGYAVYIDNPIEVPIDNVIYRLLVGFPGYAVSAEGMVYNMNTKKAISKLPVVDQHDPMYNKYKYISIHSYIRGEHITMTVHRLVASAWVPNDEYDNKSLVNHIDGIKSNYAKDNLEWVTYNGNIKHAFKAGLRTDNIKIKLRDVNTGVIKHFNSSTEAVEYAGVNSKITLDTYLPGRALLAKRYEVKLESDDGPWKHKQVNVSSNHYLVKLNDSVYIVRTMDDVCKLLNIDKQDVPNLNVYKTSLISLYKKLHPEDVLNIEYVTSSSEYEAMNVVTGEVVTAKRHRELAELTGAGKSTVTSCILSDRYKVVNNWVYRRKSDEPWDEKLFKYPKIQPKQLIAENVITGEKSELKSLRVAERKYNVARRTIQRLITTKQPLIHNTIHTMFYYK